MAAFHRIYLDANIIIEMVEARTEVSHMLQRFALDHPVNVAPKFATSKLTLAEVLVQPFWENRREVVELYTAMLSGEHWLSMCDLSETVLETAALLRAARKSLKLPDAIHIATAIRCGCSHLLTDDHGVVDVGPLSHPFRTGILPGVPVIRPDQTTISQIIEDLAA